jgi:hypothetical protein
MKATASDARLSHRGGTASWSVAIDLMDSRSGSDAIARPDFCPRSGLRHPDVDEVSSCPDGLAIWGLRGR